MKKTHLLLLTVILLILSVFFILRYVEVKNKSENTVVNKSLMIAIGDAYKKIGILPPSTGYEEFTKKDVIIRLQYIDSKASLIESGLDKKFNTKDDKIYFYKINKFKNLK